MSKIRHRCGGCTNRVTPNQLKANKGLCTHCGFDIERAMWERDAHRNLTMVQFDKDERDALFTLARENEIPPNVLVRLAVNSKLFVWASNPEAIKQDQMLAKLTRR